MNFELHKLPEGFIITSSEKQRVELGKLYYEADNTIPIYSFTKETLPEQYYLPEVIAQQDQIDFSALLEDDCKKIGWFDYFKIADEANKNLLLTSDGRTQRWCGIIEGFQKAQELLSDRMFTKKDMAKFGQFMIRKYVIFRNNDATFSERMLSEFLSQQSWKIEVEMNYNGNIEQRILDYPPIEPKLTNGKVKILKIL